MSTKRTPQSVAGAETMSSAIHLAVEYHRWFYELAEPYLGRRILDIGSGVGNHLPYFEGRELVCLDLSPEAVSRLAERFGGPGREFIAGDISDPAVVETLRARRIDTATCFNVLEHIEDFRGALANAHDVLEPERGHLILIVPAHEFLYGAMDHLAGHYRRFNKRELSGVLREHGFEVVKARYVNALGAVGWLVNGRVFKPKSLSTASINTQLVLFSRFVVPGIKLMERKLSPPFGQSLLVVGRAR